MRDSDSFDEFYRATSVWLLRYGYAVTGDLAEAQDRSHSVRHSPNLAPASRSSAQVGQRCSTGPTGIGLDSKEPVFILAGAIRVIPDLPRGQPRDSATPLATSTLAWPGLGRRFN